MSSLARPSIAQFNAVVRNITRETLSRVDPRDIPWGKVLADIGLLILFALTCSILTRP